MSHMSYEFMELGWFEMKFLCEFFMIHLRTISFFSNRFLLIQSQCDIVIFKITGEIEYLHVFLLESYPFCYFNQT